MVRHYRKVIRIRAVDSPNVQLALTQQQMGLPVTHERIVPGVITWAEYQKRRKLWDPVMQCIKLDAEFYEGAEVLMYPPEWLNKAEAYAAHRPENTATALGIDTAEGGDKTCWAAVGSHGLVKLVALKTPDTAVITGRTIAMMNEFDIEPEMVMFDQGGGGQEHADRLRYQGYDVQTVSFGESVTPEPVRFLKQWEEKQHERRERYVYKNRRAQMYWLLHLALDPGTEETPYPNNDGHGFGIPAEYTELRRQLSVIQTLWDEEGRIMMPPKRRKPGQAANSKAGLKSLEELLGCSPDEADAVVLAMYALQPGSQGVTVSPIF